MRMLRVEEQGSTADYIESGKKMAAMVKMLEKRAISIYEGDEGKKGIRDKGAKDDKGDKGRKNKVDAKKRYDEAVANMTEMVKNGEMTREQMEQRIERMKKRMRTAAGNERTRRSPSVNTTKPWPR